MARRMGDTYNAILAHCGSADAILKLEKLVAQRIGNSSGAGESIQPGFQTARARMGHGAEGAITNMLKIER
jgi:hypothetical protein